jgi:hypothetical protein
MSLDGRSSMRPTGLSEAVNRIQAGASRHAALAEFVDAFNLASSDEARFAMLEKAPVLTKDKRLDALVGAIAEDLAKQYKLGRVPSGSPGRHAALTAPGTRVQCSLTGSVSF